MILMVFCRFHGNIPFVNSNALCTLGKSYTVIVDIFHRYCYRWMTYRNNTIIVIIIYRGM
jgi:hypothetical protein